MRKFIAVTLSTMMLFGCSSASTGQSDNREDEKV